MRLEAKEHFYPCSEDQEKWWGKQLSTLRSCSIPQAHAELLAVPGGWSTALCPFFQSCVLLYHLHFFMLQTVLGCDMRPLMVFSSSKPQIFKNLLSVKVILKSNTKLPHYMFPFAILLLQGFLSVMEISKQLSFIFTPWLISHIIKTPHYILSSLYTLYSIVPLPPTFAYSVSPKASPYSPFIPHTPMYFNNAET